MAFLQTRESQSYRIEFWKNSSVLDLSCAARLEANWNCYFCLHIDPLPLFGYHDIRNGYKKGLR